MAAEESHAPDLDEQRCSDSANTLRLACLTPLPAQRSLLSLPDHILQQIGYEVSEDNHQPYPAFAPSWLNQASPQCSLRPLRDYRAICQRIRHLVPLSGTWLVINTMSALQTYAWVASEELVRSVSRLKIRIDTSFKDGSSNGVLSIVSHLLRLLQRTPNLRELRIARPVHAGSNHHAAVHPPLSSIAIPPISLPKLEHLYVKIACEDCSSGLEDLLVSLAPNLRSLKMYLPDSKGCAPLQKSFDIHSLRFGSQMMLLDMLILRIGPEVDVELLLGLIAGGAPALKELHVSTYKEKEMKLALSIEVSATDQSARCEVYHASATKGRVHLAGFWRQMALLTRVEILDLGLTVRVAKDDRGAPPIARAPMSLQDVRDLEVQQLIWSLPQKRPGRGADVSELEMASERLLETCPRLRKGWWWSRRLVASGELGSEIVYERIEWGVSATKGGPVVALSDGALWLAEEFLTGYG